MSEVNYSEMRGVADEPNWNVFIPTAGGELLSPLITRPKVQKADYLFRSAKVVAELKVLETEFGNTPQATEKVAVIMDRYKDADLQHPPEALRRELLGILRAPLQRIVKKANNQIKSTKNELGLFRHEGILICVNDNFRQIPPSLAIALLASVVASGTFSSVKAIVYITNHYVEVPTEPDALLLWHPMYSEHASSGLQDFINELGRRWLDYTEKLIGPFDSRSEYDSIDLSGATVVSGVLRNTKYLGSQ